MSTSPPARRGLAMTGVAALNAFVVVMLEALKIAGGYGSWPNLWQAACLVAVAILTGVLTAGLLSGEEQLPQASIGSIASKKMP
jgi:hypothetical protein